MLKWNLSLIRIRIQILKAQKLTDPEGGTGFGVVLPGLRGPIELEKKKRPAVDLIQHFC
jgi:hypothetical protein